MKFFSRRTKDRTEHEGSETRHSRRSFLHQIGLVGVWGAIAGLAYQSVRSLIPNVLYESPRRFKIGLPGQLAEGVTFLTEKRLYVFKQGRSFYAISGTCTHLGCTVKHTKLNSPKHVTLDGEDREIDFEFHCPCHGSRFYSDGTNYAGPAPSPLRWYRLTVSPDDGQLLVDMGEEVERNYRLTV